MAIQPLGKADSGILIHCVLVTSFEAEYSFLRNVLWTAGMRVHHAESLEEADFLLTVTGSTVLLSDVIFDGGYWQGASELLRRAHPLVTMLVVAEPADRAFVSDVLAHGACGILWKPFEFASLKHQIRVVHEAAEERRALTEEDERFKQVLPPKGLSKPAIRGGKAAY
jgi:DNA-binding NtrC family response regulator